MEIFFFVIEQYRLHGYLFVKQECADIQDWSYFCTYGQTSCYIFVK